MPTPDDFFELDIRIGTVTRAEAFPEARKPSYKLEIAFGVLGVKRSSAQLTHLYRPEDLVGRQVVCVLNLGGRRIAGFVSEVLVLGGMVTAEEVVLLAAERPVVDGTRVA